MSHRVIDAFWDIKARRLLCLYLEVQQTLTISLCLLVLLAAWLLLGLVHYLVYEHLLLLLEARWLIVLACL